MRCPPASTPTVRAGVDHPLLSPCELIAPSPGAVSLYICSLGIFLLDFCYYYYYYYYLEQCPVRHAKVGMQTGATTRMGHRALFGESQPHTEMWGRCCSTCGPRARGIFL